MLYDTPYDDCIAALSAELDQTRIFYGDKTRMAAMEARKREADAIYEAAAPAAVAKRTIQVSTKGRRSAGCLPSRCP